MDVEVKVKDEISSNDQELVIFVERYDTGKYNV